MQRFGSVAASGAKGADAAAPTPRQHQAWRGLPQREVRGSSPPPALAGSVVSCLRTAGELIATRRFNPTDEADARAIAKRGVADGYMEETQHRPEPPWE